MELGYRAAPRLGERRRNDSMQKTGESAQEHPRPERHGVPLVLEIRFPYRARVIQEESIEHFIATAGVFGAITIL
jgi:hypothetical protein